MGAFTAYTQKRLIDFVLGGESATPPPGRWLGLTDINGAEPDASIGYVRRTAVFAAAASPAGSATMQPTTFGPYTSIASAMSVFALQLFDASAAGNALAATTFATPHTFKNGGGIIVAGAGITLV